MKINTFTAFLSVALAGIIAYFLSCYESGENQIVLAVGGFLSMAITLIGTLSLSFDYERTTALTRMVSGVFFMLLLVSQIIFATLESFLVPTYVLVTGGLSIISAIVIYGISRSKH
jgi:hypothetical protein